MIINLLRENRTLREILLGIWIFGVLMGAVLSVFFPPILYRLIGLASGLLAASGMTVHMAYCIDRMVELDEKGAGTYIRKMTIIRYVAVCLLLVVLALTKAGDPISFVIGALSLKIGAYSQPLIHKLTGGKENEPGVFENEGSADTISDNVLAESDLNNNDKGGE